VGGSLDEEEHFQEGNESAELTSINTDMIVIDREYYTVDQRTYETNDCAQAQGTIVLLRQSKNRQQYSTYP
jgi:hypothetical protein